MGMNNKDHPERRRVGLIFDDRMCKHKQPGRYEHPENPERIRAIWEKLNSSGVAQRCVVLNAKEAKDNDLALVHSKEHVEFIKTISSRNIKTMRKRAEKFDSIYFNKGSSESAYLAAGSVIQAAKKVARGELDSAFAIVRPPGHHAEAAEPMGFCLLNNVAIATSVLLDEGLKLGISKFLIVDWDVHHGNSTQKMFYDDPRVLVFSVHRHDSGRFYPEGNDGSYSMIGEGPGAGYNINVPWENGGCGDADYLAVWEHILIPVAMEFDPDIIIISAGFDAALGDPIGGCCLNPSGYSIMLEKLMKFARGKIVMALEGGYDPVSLANSTQTCVQVLLQDKPLIGSSKDLPLESTWRVIKAVRQALRRYWSEFACKLPDEVLNMEGSTQEKINALRFETNLSRLMLWRRTRLKCPVPRHQGMTEQIQYKRLNAANFEEEWSRYMYWRKARLTWQSTKPEAWKDINVEEDRVVGWSGCTVREALGTKVLIKFIFKQKPAVARAMITDMMKQPLITATDEAIMKVLQAKFTVLGSSPTAKWPKSSAPILHLLKSSIGEIIDENPTRVMDFKFDLVVQ